MDGRDPFHPSPLSRTLPFLARQVARVPGLAYSVQLVGDREHGMAKQHPGAGVSHDLHGLGPLRRLVAVNGTIGASWFVFAIGTFLQPHIGVVQEFTAIRAQDACRAVVMIRAIDTDHPGHGQPLTSEVSLVLLHYSLNRACPDAAPASHLIQSRTVHFRPYVIAQQKKGARSGCLFSC